MTEEVVNEMKAF